jgi:Fur family ferric uptake transcriptional regulator
MVFAKHLEQRWPFASRWRGRDLRLTPQRMVMGSAIELACEPLDTPEVLRRADEQMSGLHLATVYRTLDSFKERGVIGNLDRMDVKVPGHLYEARTGKDPTHLTFRRWGKVVEIQTSLFEKLKDQTEGRHGLSTRVARLELGGLIGNCESEGGNKNSVSG